MNSSYNAAEFYSSIVLQKQNQMSGNLVTPIIRKQRKCGIQIINLILLALIFLVPETLACADPNEDPTQCTDCQGGQVLLQSRCFAKVRGCLSYDVTSEFQLLCTECQNGYLKFEGGCQRSAVVLNNTSNQIPPVTIRGTTALNPATLGLQPSAPPPNRTQPIHKKIKLKEQIQQTLNAKFPDLKDNDIFIIAANKFQNINNLLNLYQIQYVNGLKVLIGQIMKNLSQLTKQQEIKVSLFAPGQYLVKYFVVSTFSDQKMAVQYQIINNSSQIDIVSARQSLNYDIKVKNQQNITDIKTLNTETNGISLVLDSKQIESLKCPLDLSFENVLISEAESEQDKFQKYYKNAYDLFLLDPNRTINITQKAKRVEGYLVNGTFVNLQFKTVYESQENFQQYLVLGYDIRNNKVNVVQYFKGAIKTIDSSQIQSTGTSSVGTLNLINNQIVYAERNQSHLIAFLTALPQFQTLISETKVGYKILSVDFHQKNYIYEIKVLLSSGIHLIKLKDDPLTKKLALLKTEDDKISTIVSQAQCAQIPYLKDTILKQLDSYLRKSYVALSKYPNLFTQYKANEANKVYRFLYLNNDTYQQVEFMIDQPIQTGKYKLRTSNILNQGYGYFGEQQKQAGISVLSMIGKQFYDAGTPQSLIVEKLSEKYQSQIQHLYTKYSTYVKDGVIQGIMSNGTHIKVYISTSQYSYEYTVKAQIQQNNTATNQGQLVILQRKQDHFAQNLLPPGFNSEYEITQSSPDYSFMLELQNSIIDKYKYYLANYLDWVYAQKQPASSQTSYGTVYQFLFKSAFGYYQIEVTANSGSTQPILFGPLRRLTNWPDSRLISSQQTVNCDLSTQIHDKLQNRCYDKIQKCIKQIGGICVLCEPDSVLQRVFKKQCVIDCQKTMSDE